jgi:hypothetical protein
MLKSRIDCKIKEMGWNFGDKRAFDGMMELVDQQQMNEELA